MRGSTTQVVHKYRYPAEGGRVLHNSEPCTRDLSTAVALFRSLYSSGTTTLGRIKEIKRYHIYGVYRSTQGWRALVICEVWQSVLALFYSTELSSFKTFSEPLKEKINKIK